MATKATKVHEAVKAKFRTWIIGKGATGEGMVPFMYKDSVGLVTIGIGNLIDTTKGTVTDKAQLERAWKSALRRYGRTGLDPKNYALVNPKGAATQSDLEKCWKTVKSHPPKYANSKLYYKDKPWYRRNTRCRLSSLGLVSLFAKARDGKLSSLGRFFQGYSSYPADAQIALLGLAWGKGSWGAAILHSGVGQMRHLCKQKKFACAAEVVRSKYPARSESARQRRKDIAGMLEWAQWVENNKKDKKKIMYFEGVGQTRPSVIDLCPDKTCRKACSLGKAAKK